MPPTHATRTAPPRARTVLTVVILAALGVSTVLGATAAAADPAVRVTDAELTPDGTATADVVLTAAPNGLAGFAVEVRVGDGVATITNASYPDTFGLTTEPSIAEDGRRVTLEAADLGGNVQPGAADVVLGTVELTGVAPGEARLRVEPLQFDADNGSAIRPPGRAGTVTVAAGTAGTPTEAAAGSAEAPSDGTASSGAESGGTAVSEAAAGSPEAATTSTAFGLPAGGVVVAALALAVLAAGLFAMRRDWWRRGDSERRDD